MTPARKNNQPATELRRADRNSQLMREMGSKTGRYDPEPPDQYLYVLRHGSAEERVVAWVKSKTVAVGRQSPYAVNQRGETQKLQHLAADLGWKEQTARNVVNTVEKSGRIQVDEKGCIWLCADVPLGDEGRTGSEESNSVQSYIPPYLLDSIKNLSPNDRASLENRYQQYDAWRRGVIADAVASARSITERVENTILGEFGLERRRNSRESTDKPAQVEVSLIRKPNFVQSYEGKSCTESDSTLYKTQNGFVQSLHPLCVQTTDNRPSSSQEILNNKEKRAGGQSVSLQQADGLADSDLNSILEAIPPALIERLREAPGRKLLKSIQRTLGGCPLTMWTMKIRQKQQKIESLGLLLNLAQDVRAAWDLTAVSRAKSKQILREQEEEQLRDAARTARKILQDPDVTAWTQQDRDWATELLGGAE